MADGPSFPLLLLQAGLNLNIFGALAGALSSKSSKETAEDGSTLETEEKRAGVKGQSFPQIRAVSEWKFSCR